ncbi:tagaturonate reductase [Bifidobacterium catulorum]|uniref:Tagaturonate reductase n=1 Tax=Bifidobacterium catulorum TaxID=1630173 RepID=A0A2U2MTW7_9BIFI|nr:tagaturonate reductase [Bifidobacterium catulorum]PWG60276.1 tagaturonate reductase [Bifidobacterium catulorum]
MTDNNLPVLNAEVAIDKGLTTADAAKRPIKVIQFGEGNFLRAFVDWTIQQLNDNDLFGGNVAIVQPIAQGRTKELAAQDNLYTVILEGLKNGEQVQSRELIDSIGKSLSAVDDWDEFLALADEPEAKIIISNTTEAGIALDDSDTAETVPPKSYPAKLIHLLKRRFDNGLPGFLIIPCELIADNGDTLKKYLLELAGRFGYGEDFKSWLENDNKFFNTLVDRIVPGYPRDRAEELWNELGYVDNNMVKAEPFLLWVIAGDAEAIDEALPAKKLGIDLVTPESVKPYRERKVFLLNCPHTTLASVARLAGVATVGEAMNDEDVRPFIEKEMHEEIIPVLSLPEDELNRFAEAVLERYANPFVKHALDAIGLNSAAKYVTRCLPVLLNNVKDGHGLPKRLVLALSGLIYTYGGLAEGKVNVTDDPAVVAKFEEAAKSENYAAAILADESVWGQDLTKVDGLVDAVAANLDAIKAEGMRPLIKALA